MNRLFLVALAGLVLSTVQCVRHGDEQFEHTTDGYFYVFCNGDVSNGVAPSIDIVDPKTKTVVNSIRVDTSTSWSDPVYMERCGEGSNAQLMLVNDRSGFVYVVDTATQTVIEKVPMSERPVHAYGIPHSNEFWSHADGDGVFDVIHLSNPSQLHVEDVVAHIDAPGHGKLLWDPALWPFGYASNTRESFVYEFNLVTKEVTRTINLTATNEDLHCSATHGLAYSSINGHIYATCSSGGLIEINPDSWTVVQKLVGFNGGQVYQSADETVIIDINKNENKIHIALPRAHGQPSEILYEVDCPGNPDKAAFYQLLDGSWRVFFSLTSPKEADPSSPAFRYINLHDIANVETDSVVAAPVLGGQGTSPYRSIKTGGHFVATITRLPESGISLANAATGASFGFVATNNSPSRISWAPRYSACPVTNQEILESAETLEKFEADVQEELAALKARMNFIEASPLGSTSGEDDDSSKAAVIGLAVCLCVSILALVFLALKLKQNRGAYTVGAEKFSNPAFAANP